jgi:hypothetical protein
MMGHPACIQTGLDRTLTKEEAASGEKSAAGRSPLGNRDGRDDF